ncbi:MAG: hypothetical protein ACR2M2_00255, partial [Gaiellaceae bacterium]
MPEIPSPRELFLHELGDILYFERELVEETLPKLIGEVQDAESRKAWRSISARRVSTRERGAGIPLARRG